MILTKLNKQQIMMNKQYHHLMDIISNHEAFRELKGEIMKLLMNIDKNIHLSNSNQRMLLDVFDQLEQFSQSVLPLLKLHGDSLKVITNNLELLLTHVQNIEKQLNLLNELGDAITHQQHKILKNSEDTEKSIIQLNENLNKRLNDIILELNQTKKKLESTMTELLNNKLKEVQDDMTNDILSNIEKMRKEVEQYFEQLTKQSMCEFFQQLNPGTKLNYIVVSGLEIKLTTFINYDEKTNQVKLIKNDGNLFITSCSNIEAVELKTSKQEEDS